MRTCRQPYSAEDKAEWSQYTGATQHPLTADVTGCYETETGRIITSLLYNVDVSHIKSRIVDRSSSAIGQM